MIISTPVFAFVPGRSLLEPTDLSTPVLAFEVREDAFPPAVVWTHIPPPPPPPEFVIVQTGDHTLRLDLTGDTLDLTGASGAAAADISSYVLSVISGVPGAAVSAVEVVSSTRIVLTLSDLSTDGGTYRITISGAIDAVVNGSLTGTTWDYTADVSHPYVTDVLPASTREIDVTFSRDMRLNAALLTPSKYGFTGGLTVVNVTRTAPYSVRLSLSGDMTRDALYKLSISDV